MPKKKSFNQINEQNQKIDARKSQLIKQGCLFGRYLDFLKSI